MRSRSSTTKQTVVTCVALAVASAACTPMLGPVGEGVMKMRGEIVSEGGEPCLVELRRSNNDAVAERFTAKGRFERTITIEPGTRSYYVAVSCPGAVAYTSRSYVIGATTHFTTPLDLGTLYFPRRTGMSGKAGHTTAAAARAGSSAVSRTLRSCTVMWSVHTSGWLAPRDGGDA